jgi:hypothetical protein
MSLATFDGIHCADDHQLAKGVVDMVIAADHMGHAHIVIVHHHGQHIGRRTVRAQNDEIVQLNVLNRDAALNQIVDHGRASRGALMRTT